jgi:integrase/recombinase XerD
MRTSDYQHHLQTLHYSASAQTNYPRAVEEFLDYLQSKGISDPEKITREITDAYFDYLGSRASQKRSGTLSNVYLNSHINALKNYQQYLKQLKHTNISLQLQRYDQEGKLPEVLTRQEIQQLYQTTQEMKWYHGIQAKLILHLCYGCGLRKSEVLNLHTSDVKSRDKLLHVRRGKGGKERYVPLTETILSDLQEYLTETRLKLTFKRPVEALLVNNRGEGLKTFYYTLKLLKTASKLEKELHPHLLRHSIATHLMESGMKIEEIAKFLGHKSLASTQLYTHIMRDIRF